MALRDAITKMEDGQSPLEQHMRAMHLPICKALTHGAVRFVAHGSLPAKERIAIDFPRTIALHKSAVLVADAKHGAKRGVKHAAVHKKRVAVLFSGGPAAGGHNVVAGLHAALGKDALLGVRGGPGGLLRGDIMPLTDAMIERARSTGGFSLLGTDRTKIKSQEQLAAVRAVVVRHRIDAIVIVGGDDSNTNAAWLAERLQDGTGRKVQVIGVPKTMDGDLQYGALLPISFGFSSATRVYAQLVGNILADTASSRKYWHFIRLMGRAASHVTLEVALQTKPTVTLLSEEVAAKHQTLAHVVDDLARAVVWRAKHGMAYGVVLVPEGLLEAIPEVRVLISDLSALVARHPELAHMDAQARIAFLMKRLPEAGKTLLATLPSYVQATLVADRDSHGNLSLSQIETERMLVELVAARVRSAASDVKFATNTHFFGYEGRCGAPTMFDAWYGQQLGLVAGSLVLDGRTGYLASMTQLDKGGVPIALPLTGLLTLESRKGEEELVIRKALVEMDSPAFRYFASRRTSWLLKDCACSPGPVQYSGKIELPLTVALNQGYVAAVIKQVRRRK